MTLPKINFNTIILELLAITWNYERVGVEERRKTDRLLTERDSRRRATKNSVSSIDLYT